MDIATAQVDVQVEGLTGVFAQLIEAPRQWMINHSMLAYEEWYGLDRAEDRLRQEDYRFSIEFVARCLMAANRIDLCRHREDWGNYYVCVFDNMGCHVCDDKYGNGWHKSEKWYRDSTPRMLEVVKEYVEEMQLYAAQELDDQTMGTLWRYAFAEPLFSGQHGDRVHGLPRHVALRRVALNIYNAVQNLESFTPPAEILLGLLGFLALTHNNGGMAENCESSLGSLLVNECGMEIPDVPDDRPEWSDALEIIQEEADDWATNENDEGGWYHLQNESLSMLFDEDAIQLFLEELADYNWTHPVWRAHAAIRNEIDEVEQLIMPWEKEGMSIVDAVNKVLGGR